MANSTTAQRSSAPIPSKVSGTPKWLFKFPFVRWVRPVVSSTAANISLVLLLPELPVTDATRTERRRRYPLAIFWSAI